jgi:superoxide dismutase, Fe-Mn family
MSENLNHSRRDFLKKGGLLTLAGLGAAALNESVFSGINSYKNEEKPASVKFTLPALPYAYDALEPFIDKITMEIHHTKHHQAYINNLNKAIEELKIENSTLEDLCKNISKYPVAVRNNGGGHYNHSLFWTLMKPNGGGAPSGELSAAINSAFGSFDDFKTKFSSTAVTRFGSGWAWLAVNKGKLEIGSTPNQDNPIMDISDIKGNPILCLDIWEHAYYLKYQNKRTDYISAWWNLVNWEESSRLFVAAK